jgi:hypothetical protein
VVTKAITGTSGGNFESLTTTSTVSTNVTDDADATTVTLSSATNGQAIIEGNTITYTVTTGASVQGSPLVVSLSNGQTITIPVGQSSSTVTYTVRADDVYTQGTQTLAAVSISGTSGGNFEVVSTSGSVNNTVVDDTDVTTVSITGSASVAEGGTASYTLALTSQAQSPVTVTLAYSGTAADGSDFTGVTTVLIPALSSGTTFSVPTINDIRVEGAESLTVSLVSATGGGFENLAVAGAGSGGSVTTTIVDNDTAPSLSVSSVSVAESAGFAVFTWAVAWPSVPEPTTVRSRPTICRSRPMAA